ncbi:MAG: glycosyltransferase [Candidatus Sericytochromatia bacterium]
MKLSVALHLPASAALPIRHLLASLKAQTVRPDEVLIYTDNVQDLPAQLPESWRRLPEVAERASWQQQALESCQGEYVALISEAVILHPRHFELALQELERSSGPAVALRAEFVDAELFPVVDAQLPPVGPQDWLGMAFASRLLWPLETLVLRRNQVTAADFVALDTLASAAELAAWLQRHGVTPLPYVTVQAPLQRFWVTAAHEQRQHWMQACLKSPPAGLVPAYALPSHNSSPALQQQFISLALRDWGLHTLLEAYQQRLHPIGLGLQSALWLVAGELTPWRPALAELLAQGIRPLVVQVSAGPGLDDEPYAVTYSQTEGIGLIEVRGVPSAEAADMPEHPPALTRKVFDWVLQLRPDRIHMTSFRFFSAHLPGALRNSNTPLYFSLSDDSALKYRDWLRHPEELAERKVPRQHVDSYNRLIEHALRHDVAQVLVHDAETERRLQAAGWSDGSYRRAFQAGDLAPIYRQSPLISPPSLYPSGFHLLENLTGVGLSQRLWKDVQKLKGTGRVLAFGAESEAFVTYRMGQQGWVQGVTPQADQARHAHDQGLPMVLGDVAHLPGPVRSYDALYSPYALEALSLPELRQLLASAVLALRKGGRWALRLFSPSLARQESFWLGEHQRRPWSPSLIKLLLQQSGFQIQTEELSAEGWPDIYLEAELRGEALPLLNLPLATPRVDSYWENNLPQLDLGEDDQVLLIGTHIQKTWLINRVQCGYMLGLTLNLNDLGKRQKRSERYHLRHAGRLLETLQHFTRRFDRIVLQAIPETLAPDQLRELLARCHQLLNPQGQLQILSLQCDESDDPLFWQNSLNQRPYPELGPLLLEQGFQVNSREVQEQHHVYRCLRVEKTAPVHQPPTLPAHLRTLVQQASRVSQPEEPARMMALTPQSQSCILVNNLLENTPPAQLRSALQRLHQALEPEGALVVSFQAFDKGWDHPSLQRPYPEVLLDKLLQETGFQKRVLSRHGSNWVWCGFRRLSYRPLPPEKLRLRWQGDVLNYHSLATVNRALLQLAVAQDNSEIEIVPYSDPVFEPTAGEAFFELWRQHARPLSGQPHLTVRHHWPPDFGSLDTGGHWVMIQPWEFGSLPERWIYTMNKFVDQVWVPSEYVKQSYLNSGLLPDKIAVVPNGVDTEVYSPQAGQWVLPTQKSFKFLFVGGGTLRKGVDLLLNAFVETFRADEDVCLVLKEFGAGTVYETVEVAEWLERYRRQHPDMPEILHLTEDLSPEQMPALYNSSDCLVHPFRGEGFALTVAEAMACAKPVLVTGYGPVLEYCSDENAYLIPAQEVAFKEKQIDKVLVTVDYPTWAEPDYEALKALLRHIYENRQEAEAKGQLARQHICEHLTWQHSLLKMEEQIATLRARPVFRLTREQLVGHVLGEAFSAVEAENYATAITLFQKALQMDPYQPSVHYNLGVAYIMSNQHEAALEVLTRSLREGEVTADLCYALGTTLRHLGDYPTSQQFFSKAREIDPAIFV